jgi:hypothetical protein
MSRQRDFSPTVVVIDRDGQRYDVSEAWLTKHATTLDLYPVDVDAHGRSIIRVPETIDWSTHVRLKGDVGRYIRMALLPDGSPTPVERAPVDDFKAAAQRLADTKGPSAKKAIAAAVNLVVSTGVLPYSD